MTESTGRKSMTASTAGEPYTAAGAVQLSAPAKLTLSLRVTGVRPDGYHDIDAEMVSLDLHDSLVIEPGTGLTVHFELPAAPGQVGVPSGPNNLVAKALRAVGRESRVRLTKRIPPGAGLGGGSSNAAAVLRWAGCTDLDLAARLGADVPFCVVGGRARVRGIGESVDPLPYEERRFVLLLPPFGVNTAAVYRAWDRLSRSEGIDQGRTDEGPVTVGPVTVGPVGGGQVGVGPVAEGKVRDGQVGVGPVAESRVGDGPGGKNDLEAAALHVEPRLAAWRDRFAEVGGARPLLAGSGSTWFLEGTPAELGIEGQAFLRVGAAKGALVPVRTVREDYSPPDHTR
jgi:4-diphosphocytidyl-2-C-methyl-D-erythritol kinase